MAKTIKAYRVTTREAYRIDEIGTGYSLMPGNDSDHYKQDNEQVTIKLADGVEVGEDIYGLPAIVKDGRAYRLQEAIDAGYAKVAK